LLVGDVIGRAGGSSSLIRSAWKEDRECFRNLSLMRVIVTARRFAKFASVTSMSGIVNAVGLFGPALLFSALFGPATAGQVALSQRVIALPLTLAGQSVAQVYIGEVARLAHEMPTALPALIRSTVRRLAVVALLPALALILAGPWMFALVFGAPWRVAGTYAQILALAFAFQMIAAPISQTLNVLGRPRLQFAWDVGRSFLVLGGIWGAWRAGLPAIAAMWVYSVAMVLAYASMVGIASGVARDAGARGDGVRRE
jgi:O-antigen/teichoic acid export membrane protein